MKGGPLKLFPTSLDGAAALQRKLAARVETADRLDGRRWVAGVDLSYDTERGVCHAAAVLCDRRTGDVAEVAHCTRPVDVPYVPGLLSFREGPGILGALDGLSRRPHLVICDGQGLAHPRRFGLACHIGVALDIPCFGAAKSRLVGNHREPGHSRGCSVRLVDRGETIGRVVRTRSGVRPLFVSCGHRVSLETAVHQTLFWARRFRLPEPTRLAHLAVSRRKMEARRAARA